MNPKIGAFKRRLGLLDTSGHIRASALVAVAGLVLFDAGVSAAVRQQGEGNA